MKYVIGIIAVLAGLIGLLQLSGNDSSSPTAKVNGFTTIQSDVASGASLIDVRTTEEFAAGHIDGAQHHSLQVIQSGVLPQADKSSTLYVYCQSGNRSAEATKLLREAGYADVVDLGGIGEVQELGGKIVKS